MLQEIRVLFSSQDENTYGVELQDVEENVLGVPASCSLFLQVADYEDLRWYLEEFMDLPDGGAVVRAQAIEQRLNDWGRQLYRALFSDPANGAVLKELLDSPEPRELTIATDVSDLLRLPWELMADDAGPLAQRVSVRRQLAVPDANIARKVKLPLRMLYIVSRPADTGFIDPRMTTKSLFEATDPLGANVRIDFCRPPTLDRMETLLREAQVAKEPYDLVHFDGHGTFLEQEGIGALCFEKPDDGTGKSQMDLVLADRLGILLAKFQIPLVILEACRSATLGSMAVFRSVAPRLIQAGVGSVLSMGHAVHVEAARILLDRVYRELVRGTTIGHAVAEGRAALTSTPARWIEQGPRGRTIALQDWFLPHLYQRGLDEPLLPKDAANQPQARQFDVFLSHNHNDSPRVEKLARLLSETYGLRVWLDKWECNPGKLEPQCEAGIRNSRFTVVVGSQDALKSKWVAWEIDKHNELNPQSDRLIPIKFEELTLPKKLNELLWVDFTDPTQDAENAALVVQYIRSGDAEDARRRRGFRSPPARGEPGCFPRPPQFGFQGRARELYDLESRFRRARGVVLHAMGGMGKTTLATEAADWWTRSGLFRDGACFISFEQFVNAERVVQVLGGYLEGPKFDQRPGPEQRRRAIEFFRDHDVLMVWDNYESVLPQFNDGAAEHGSPYTDEERGRLATLFHDLTTGAGKGRLLVTCRPGETGLPGAQHKELQGLARPDSLWLLQRIMERHEVPLNDARYNRSQLEPLLQDLADHPLSLELVGPHLRTLTPEAIRADFGKLLDQFQQDSEEGRNRSLRASLEFSRRHLSPAAQSALPWLGLFRGGVFEQFLLDISQIEPAAWEPIQRELQGIALLRVEHDVTIGGRPFLRFHPTLAIASAERSLSEQPEIRERFVAVYVAVMRMLDQAFDGDQSRTAIAILNGEEANYRTAVRWAVSDQQHQIAASLGNTLGTYLQMTGRLREYAAWVDWLHQELTQSNLTDASASVERDHAWTLFTQGDREGAVAALNSLIDRLRITTEFDSAFQLASATLMLGRVFDNSYDPKQAIPILREAIGLWEQIIEKQCHRTWQELMASSEPIEVVAELQNLSASMGNLANSLIDAGKHEEALAVAEKGIAINKRMGNLRNVATGHVRCAQILMMSGRFEEADARYDEALKAARDAGDKAAIGTTFQHQGKLARHRDQLERAVDLYKQALQFFQESGDTEGMMRTYNLLGVVERKSGRLAEARAWYEKSYELAVQLKAQSDVAVATQNLGIVCQLEGEGARAIGDESLARQHFEKAKAFIEESLGLNRVRDDKPGEADSLSQLARIHLLLGNLDAAEQNAHEAREIYESLSLIDVWRNYDTLAEVAEARGDTRAAAEWQRKRDAMLAERKRRAVGSGGLSTEMLQALQQLTIACAKAGFGGEPLGSAEDKALATLDQLPAPFPDFAASLRQLAAGNLPTIPDSLTGELGQLLQAILQAIQSATDE